MQVKEIAQRSFLLTDTGSGTRGATRGRRLGFSSTRDDTRDTINSADGPHV